MALSVSGKDMRIDPFLWEDVECSRRWKGGKVKGRLAKKKEVGHCIGVLGWQEQAQLAMMARGG